MTDLQETFLMSDFSCNKQRIIVEEIYANWNTSHPTGIRAALSDSAWQGFIAGLEACQRYYEKK